MELEVDGDWRPTVAGSGVPAAAWIPNWAHLQPCHPGIQVRFSGDYIRRWVPELRHVDVKDLLSGEIGALERRDYPEPW